MIRLLLFLSTIWFSVLSEFPVPATAIWLHWGHIYSSSLKKNQWKNDMQIILKIITTRVTNFVALQLRNLSRPISHRLESRYNYAQRCIEWTTIPWGRHNPLPTPISRLRYCQRSTHSDGSACTCTCLCIVLSPLTVEIIGGILIEPKRRISVRTHFEKIYGCTDFLRSESNWAFYIRIGAIF